MSGVDHDGRFMDLTKGRNGLVFIGQNLRSQLFHLRYEMTAQQHRQGGYGGGADGKCRPPCQGVTDGCPYRGGERKFVIGQVESANEPCVYRVVVLEGQQGYRAE